MKTRLDIPTLSPKQEKHFWDRVSRPAFGCWEWQGALLNGYGHPRLGDKHFLAHRISWALSRGPLVPKYLDHTCRNRRCVNPVHLQAVTARQNTLRGVAPTAINAHKTYCVNGHALTPENIYTVRSRPRARYCKACTISRSAKAYTRKACAIWFARKLSGVV